MRAVRPNPRSARQTRSKQTLWLTPLPGPPYPQGAVVAVQTLPELLRRLAEGTWSAALVDHRFRLLAMDAWEVALLIRERHPQLPLSVWPAPPGASNGPHRRD